MMRDLVRVGLGLLLVTLLAGCATGRGQMEGWVEPEPDSAFEAGQDRIHPGLVPDRSPMAGFRSSGGMVRNPEGFRLGSGDQVVCYDTFDWRTGLAGTNCSEVPR